VLTRCPACETHFRVTAEQLKARSGRVRCGECQHIFNALDSLIEEPMLMAAPPVAEATPPDVAPSLSDADAPAATPAAEVDEIAVPPAPTPEPTPALTPDGQEDISTSSPPEMEGPPAPEAIEAAEPGSNEPVTAEPETVEPIAAEPETPDWSETFPEPPPPPRRWPWAIGSLVALAALGLQAALAFRVELAILSPEIKPALIALCDIADCEVGLPAKVGLVGIEASDLHPDTEGRLSLTATLKNRAPFAQQYPHLELTLTDTADKAIARKILAPADYLPPKTSFANGMPPNADIMVAIGVDPGEMAASGYRLYLFYP
jgi:predicted Zn finger-like uncharacterized protein